MRYDEVTYTIFLDKPSGTINSLALLCSAALVSLAVVAAGQIAPHVGGSAVAMVRLLGVAGAALASYLLLVRARALHDATMLWLGCGYALAAAGLGIEAATATWAVPVIWHAGLAGCALCAGRVRRASCRWMVGGVVATLLAAAALGAVPSVPATAATAAALAATAVSLCAVLRWGRVTVSRTTCTQAWVLLSLSLATWDMLFVAMGARGFVAVVLTNLPFVGIGTGLLNGFAKLFKAINRNQHSLEQRVAAEVERARSLLAPGTPADDASRARIERVLAEQSFSIVFQPIDDLSTGRTVGFEALSRFAAEPIRPPDQWFAEAAAVGLGEQLEFAAVEAALAHLPEIPAGSYVSLNLSGASICSGRLEAVLAGTDVNKVVLEITEHERIDDYERLRTVLAGLRRRGLRVAVDDAGAGFASFTHVVRLAPDIIKLDRGLVSGIAHDPVRHSLAAALIRFSHEIRAAVVAEGIETANDLVELRLLGVRYGQGYYLARPAPLKAVLPRCDIVAPRPLSAQRA